MVYNNAIEKFTKFRREYNLGLSWPATISDVVFYIAFLAKKHWAHSTISVHMSAISFLHKINNWSDPTNAFIIKKLKEGSRRVSSNPDNRRPITFPLLKAIVGMLPAMCSSSYEVTLFKSAFLLAFFGFLRVGEYACLSKNRLSNHVINIEDVSVIGGQCVSIHLHHSKADQRGKGADITIVHSPDKVCCPLQALQSFLAIRPPVKGPLFIHFNQEPMTMFQISSMLKKIVHTLGLPKEDFSPHSFRIGAATSAAMGGASDESIQKMGRWSSDAFQAYIRPEFLIAGL